MTGIPCETLFEMRFWSFEHLGSELVEGQYYYSIKTDTLYYRENKNKEWKVFCAGNCDEHKTACPVKSPMHYQFRPIGKIDGTQLDVTKFAAR